MKKTLTERNRKLVELDECRKLDTVAGEMSAWFFSDITRAEREKYIVIPKGLTRAEWVAEWLSFQTAFLYTQMPARLTPPSYR